MEKIMSNEHIKVQYYNDDPAVYRDDKLLNEKEVVDLLCEFFEDCDTLINEKEELEQQIIEIEKAKDYFYDRVFQLIEEHLEKDKREYKMCYESYLNGRIEVLEELRKELQE